MYIFYEAKKRGPPMQTQGLKRVFIALYLRPPSPCIIKPKWNKIQFLKDTNFKNFLFDFLLWVN